jgi:flagellar biosynthesis/type III secretory pathway protein FliH
MDPAKYEYQSEFARHYFAQGRAEGRAEGEAEGEAKGRAEGKAEVVAKLLSLRFGTLPDSAQRRLRNASVGELDRIAERVLTAASLDEALH